MAEQKIGPVLDGLGVTLDMEDDDLIASAVVLAKVVDNDGQVALYIGVSHGLSWIDQLGLLAAAQQVSQQTTIGPRDED